MKHILLLFTLFGSLHLANAQDQAANWCRSTETLNEWLSADDNNQAILEANEAALRKAIESGNFKRGDVYRIPVVFHVLHVGGSENAIFSRLVETIDVMNEDFNGENPGIARNVAPDMMDLVADADFEFRIATIDPDGNPTNGVERFYDERTDDPANYNQSGIAIKGARQWPTDKYLNIYICKNIGSSGVAGYATFPDGANANTDGIVLANSLVGASNNPSGASHEAGHYFRLYHTWGNCVGGDNIGTSAGCGCDDQVDDTPLCAGTPPGTISCTKYDHNTCNEGPNDRNDNYANIMDYSYCFANFTPGQVERMRAAANSFSYRKNLWQEENISATGTGYDDMPDKPFAAFYPSVFNAAICAGSAITYTYDGFENVDTYSWEFPGGTPATSTEKNPSVTYTNSGMYNATLTVSNASGTSTFTYENVVEVSGASAIETPYFESFEGIDLSTSEEITIENVDNDTRTWVVKNGVGYESETSLYINNRINGLGKLDRIITNPIDLSAITEAEQPAFSFDYAFAQKASSNTDKLTLWVSTDCGVSFAKRKTYNGKTILKTAENTTGNFEPASADEWAHSDYDLSSYSGQSIQIMLEFESGGGNNIYIDNFSVTKLNGINAIENVTNLSIAPNPMNDQATLNFNLKQANQTEVAVYNMLGQKLQVLVNDKLSTGEHQIDINKGTLATGVYMISVKSGETATTKKLIIQ